MKPNTGLDPRISKIIDNALLFGLGVAIIGAVLNLKRIAGAKELLIVGIGTIINCVLVKYLSLKTLDGFITGIAIVFGCLAVLFKLLHLPGSELLIKLAIAGGIVYGINTLKGIFFPIKEEE